MKIKAKHGRIPDEKKKLKKQDFFLMEEKTFLIFLKVIDLE